jgi:hypothetical protein
MRVDRVDLLLQYALLRAGEEDSFVDQDLGPIHLLKYVYLGDLAYARTHEGETFTGAPWRFYHFGPWAAEVFNRIEPAMTAIHARKFVGQSNFEERSDWTRWSLTNDRLLNDARQNIPPMITIDLDRLVHKFKKDTPSLLDYVYRTAPMLLAAPNESLDFTREPQFVKPTPASEPAGLSARQTKKLRAAATAIRAKYATLPKPVDRFVPNAAPLDEVHEQGMSWLDGLAGQPFHPMDITAEFSPDVWTSSARNVDDVP